MEKDKTPENYRKAMWPRRNALLCPKDQYEEGEGMGINEERISQIENYPLYLRDLSYWKDIVRI